MKKYMPQMPIARRSINKGIVYDLFDLLINDDIVHQPTTIKRVCPLKIILPLVSKRVGFKRNVSVCLTAFLKVKSSRGTPFNV